MSADYPGDYEAAVAFLDRRIGYGIRPGLERIERLLELMGDPHHSYPILHVAGTNGKTTVVRMISDILGAHGLINWADDDKECYYLSLDLIEKAFGTRPPRRTMP